MTNEEKLRKAILYIAERYVYNAKNYPALANLTIEQGRNFAVTHSILHVQKSMTKIARECYREASLDKVILKEACTKMFINILKLAEILSIDPKILDSSMMSNPGHSIIDQFLALSEHIGTIAAECENFDHSGFFNELVAKQAVVTIFSVTMRMSRTYADTDFDDTILSFPSYMKS